MSITTFSPHDLSEEDYKTLRYNLLYKTEGFGDIGHPGEVYLDSTGNYTIGIGFNLEDGDVLDAVIKYFFTGSASGALLSEDINFASDIENIISNASSESQLRIDLDTKMLERKNYWDDVHTNDPEEEIPNSLRPSFIFTAPSDAETVLNYVVEQASVGKEYVLDQWLDYRGITSINEHSQERAVLVSLAYNNLIHEADLAPENRSMF